MIGKRAQLVAPSFLGNTAARIYEMGSGVKQSTVNVIRINNTDTVAHTFTIAIGDPTAAANRKLYDTVTIQPAGAEPLIYSCADVLKLGDTLWAYADTASKVSIMVSGMEYT